MDISILDNLEKQRHCKQTFVNPPNTFRKQQNQRLMIISSNKGSAKKIIECEQILQHPKPTLSRNPILEKWQATQGSGLAQYCKQIRINHEKNFKTGCGSILRIDLIEEKKF
jgi:hypothetical protein